MSSINELHKESLKIMMKISELAAIKAEAMKILNSMLTKEEKRTRLSGLRKDIRKFKKSI
jgi:hypothetical protein